MEIPQSLCMACGESGLTRMILTKIPFFREVIVSSFECDACGWTNNEVQFGGAIQEKGCRYELKVRDAGVGRWALGVGQCCCGSWCSFVSMGGCFGSGARLSVCYCCVVGQSQRGRKSIDAPHQRIHPLPHHT